MKLEFSPQILEKNTQISNFTNICLVGAGLFHANGRIEIDWHEEANSFFS